MKINSIQKKVLLFMLIISLIPLAIVGYFRYTGAEELINRLEEEKVRFYFKTIEGKLSEFFVKNKKDLFFLKELMEKELSGLEDHKPISENKNEMQCIFSNFINSNTHYDQIIFVNDKGYEVVRVNNVEGTPRVIEDSQLQYKGNRYYIKESMDLKDGEIYISTVDLNQEHGEIEKPFKPILGYIAPVYVNNTFRGFLVMNLNVASILEEIQGLKEDKLKNIIIADEEGYYLLHPQKEKEWGSNRDLSTGENLKKDYSNIFDDIFDSDTLHIQKHKSGILAWYPVTITSLNDKKFILLLELEKSDYLRPFTDFKNMFYIEIIIILLILSLAGNLASRYLTRPILKLVKIVEKIGKGDFNVEIDINTNDELQLLAYEIKKMAFQLKNMYSNMEELVFERTRELQRTQEELKEMAVKDSLTGLYNRHFFNQYIQKLADYGTQKSKKLIILICDIDRFKYINDTYGHNTGDIILKEVAEILRNSARDEDIVVRYGGDEFLVALCNSNMEVGEKYIKRVKGNLDKWNNENDILNHELTLSIGYDAYDGTKDILEVINNADRMMYENKMAKKSMNRGI